MTTISLAFVLQTALVATTANSNTYTEAREKTAQTGKPLVVLVGADWCPACQTMKNSAMPQVARRGALSKVAYAVVNTDHDSGLAQQLMRGGSIPQLVMYRETPTGWKRESLVGAQDPAAIESFINRGLEGLKAPDTSLGEASRPTAEERE
ncbi:MAG TPA: thioredoxin family protein [Pirellulales bacterium]|jgi:thioredoxin-like negative regulator of GroEL